MQDEEIRLEQKVIDVSSYQGMPDWGKVKESGVMGAILRIRDRRGVDGSFEYNDRECLARGFVRGVYKYSYALTAAEAEKEAREVLQTLGQRKPELGVWLDLEYEPQRQMGSAEVKRIAGIWMETVRSAGQMCNIYCSLEWYQDVCGGLPARYWIARYPTQDTGTVVEEFRPNVGEVGWQYSSRVRVPGIEGEADMSLWFEDLYSLLGTAAY